MFSAVKMQASNLSVKCNCYNEIAGKSESRRPMNLRFRYRRFACMSQQSNNASSSQPLDSSQFTSTIGSSSPSIQLSHWNLTQRHILALNFIACAAAISATWLFCSAIPTLLAFKKAAESLEKLLDVTREELPDTMAAVRLSGMEISDLTMELSDLGQEITKGVKSSTQAVHLAEERLRQFTNNSPSASMQEVTAVETKAAGPVVARTARGIREGIIKGRNFVQLFFTFAKLSRKAVNYIKSRAKS